MYSVLKKAIVVDGLGEILSPPFVPCQMGLGLHWPLLQGTQRDTFLFVVDTEMVI